MYTTCGPGSELNMLCLQRSLGDPSHAGSVAALHKLMTAANATMFQTPYDASPLSDEECDSAPMRQLEAMGVWAPWQE